MFAPITREPRARDTQFNAPLLERTKPIPIPSDKAATTADWRELARRIQKEEDPEKVFELVQQLIVKFNTEKPRKRTPTTGQ
jgi:hypothetical protein